MTQEEKARAYDSIIEKANKMHSENCDACKACIEELIPELAESEDEKIKNRLINLIKMSSEFGGFALHKWEADEMLAWLEKQGEKHPDPYNGISFEHNGHIWGMCARDNGVDILFNRKLIQHISDEKQGEQKPILDFKAKDWYVSKVDGKIHNIYHSVDKAEPKFKVSDLVVDNCGYVWKIEGIINQFYILEGVEGGKSHPTIEWVNKTYHLWTIQDAKDGDVLVTREKRQPFIFKNYDEDTDYIYAYCGICDLVKDNSFHTDDDQLWTCYSVAGDVYPSTKEQHDFLFEKMKEAGYEWDAENKQLNKIHIVHDTYCQDNCKGFQETGKCFADGECKAKREAKQKPIWSEEDEKFVHGLIRGLSAKKDIHGHTTFSSDCIDITETIDWLKSIKDRVQPKQEWSEEDEVKINRIVACLENLNVADNDILLKDVDWLKSLKLQPKQSLDEDTQQWIDTIIKDYEDLYNTDKDHRATIQAKISILKSLRPQKYLIPSEEEIEKAAQEWDSKANFNPFYMTMEGDKPTGVKQSITTHKESFKAGVNWILNSLKDRVQSQWKPSDKQMNVLWYHCSDGSILKSLYNDLKKLKDS